MNLSAEQPVAGILTPVFSLRGPHDLGIGDTAAVLEFVDFAAENGFGLIKILPINETGGDHSPYNAISSRALEPALLHLHPSWLPDLPVADYEALTTSNTTTDESAIDYASVKQLKLRLLEKAFAHFESRGRTAGAAALDGFQKEQRDWIGAYTLFRVLLEEHRWADWHDWPEHHQSLTRARAWLETLPPEEADRLRRRERFFAYVQWIAARQWLRVKRHASERSVALMGDIPFGVSSSSADVWAAPHLFKAGWYGGTPPDRVFKHDRFIQRWGQNWGIPLYDWKAMEQENYAWWRGRVRGVRAYFDLFRIDHILGFYRIYGFPWEPQKNELFVDLSPAEAAERCDGRVPQFHPRPDDTPENKSVNCAEGERYLRVILEEAGEGRVIGEDLGEVPDYVRPNLTSLGIAGYKIPAWENRPDGRLIPGPEYARLSLATYGTHDHEPLRAMWESLVERSRADETARKEMSALLEYAGLASETAPQSFTPELHAALIRALVRSNSWIVVFMITDLFGRAERFNFPGVATGNWTQRVHARTAELRKEPILPTVRQWLEESGRSVPAAAAG